MDESGSLGETTIGSSSLGESSSTEKLLTSHSFRQRTYSKKWLPSETRLFLRALSLFGTDFSMISLFFKTRNRTQIINKFHVEEKESPEVINDVLKKHSRGEGALLRKYDQLIAHAKEEALNPGMQRSRLGSGSSLDSVDQVVSRLIRTSTIN